MNVKATALVLTKNEEDNIARCLGSLDFMHEILVVDSGSTDKTCEIAKVFSNVRLIKTEWKGFAKTKQDALEHTNHDWIFWIDADEEVGPELKRELLAMTFSDPNKCYRICRQNFFMDEKVNYSGWQNDWVIRIFNKTRTHFDDKKVHEKLITAGPIESLTGKLNHHTYKDLKTYLEKIDTYTTLGAIQRSKKDKVKPHHIITKPMSRFFRHFIFQLGFLDGKVGAIITMLSCYSVFLRVLKTLRIQEGEELYIHTK